MQATIEQLERDDPRLALPMFTLPEAANYLDVSYYKMRTWTQGTRKHKPLVTSVVDGGVRGIPFIGFAEAFIIAAAIRHKVPSRRIRPSVEAIREQHGLDHALASKLIYTDHSELLTKHDGAENDQMWVPRTNQWQFTLAVKEQLELITFAGDGYASKLRLTRYDGVDVTVDPTVGFGLPIIEESGARVRDVLDRLKGGEATHNVAHDFALTVETVETIAHSDPLAKAKLAKEN